MKPLYVPSGKAKEYGDYAINIYTGCPHWCYYCFAPSVLRRDREKFHTDIAPRVGILDALKKQLDSGKYKDKLIHLCFTCDPYPTGYDSGTTRDVITMLKDYGNRVQILTKGDGSRDFDLLDENDWYGITLDGITEHETYYKRSQSLVEAHQRGIKTWISFEPVTDVSRFFKELEWSALFVDKVKIGKLNYYSSDIDWCAFGVAAEEACRELGIDYYIKDSLRNEMERC